MTDYLPWIEKYRPKTLDEIVSHKTIIDTLKNAIRNHKLQHLLFHGPPGSGKTSCIMATARELYGSKFDMMVLNINASEERGIEVVRTRIQQFVTTKNIFSDDNLFKLVILDEADAMTGDAQAMLRKVIENFSSTTRFCLICNYVKKITVALQSRCAVYRFSPHGPPFIKKKIDQVAICENVKITDDGMNTLIKISNGDMRKAINILQATGLSYKTINEEAIIKCTGYINPEHINVIFKSLVNDSFNKAHDLITNIKNNYSYTLNDIITEISNILIGYVTSNDLKSVKNLSEKQVLSMLNDLCSIEFNLTNCTTEDIQTSAFIAVFNNYK
jgi:replication factor C subunit 3/5